MIMIHFHFQIIINHNKGEVSKEMDKMKQEMYSLSDIYGNGKKFKYFGCI